jgi:hypothetical protein
MRPSPTRGPDLAVLASTVCAALFASPARALWTREGASWWAPFALWSLCIALGWAAARQGDRDEGAPPP